MEKGGKKCHEAEKPNKKKTIIVVEGKKRYPQAPKTEVLHARIEPGEEASEVSQNTPNPSAVATGKPRMDVDHPS